MDLVVSSSGDISAIYDENLDLTVLGSLRIIRASHVEPDQQGRWFASVIDGPRLGPFERRSQAITAEVAWLKTHRLGIT